jgi:hypothetical protein
MLFDDSSVVTTVNDTHQVYNETRIHDDPLNQMVHDLFDNESL